jgi:transcriptional regulator with XRE-family HTH domain
MPVKSVSPEFARLVRAYRLERNISQERLAELAGIHPTHVGLIERGKRNPTLVVAQKIANALGLELSALVKEAEQKSSRK